MAQSPFKFKYSIDVQHIPNCPVSGAQHIGADIIVGYRFCFSDINFPNNKLPVAKINPSRTIDGAPINAICSAFALSMYDSLDNLTNKARVALKSSPRFLKRIGDHYMEVTISKADGKCTSPNIYGHFDFFEAHDFNLLDAIKSHQVVPV